MNDKVFSQSESRLVTDYLRQKHSISVPHGLIFWRMSPSVAAAYVQKNWPGKKVDAEALHDAAGRNKVGVLA